METTAKEAFFSSAGARRLEPFKTPAGTYFIREMTSVENDNREAGWENWRKVQNGSEEDARYFYAYYVRWTLCDEKGNLLFSDDDVRRLGDMPASVITPIALKALDINKARAVDEANAEKN